MAPKIQFRPLSPIARSVNVNTGIVPSSPGFHPAAGTRVAPPPQPARGIPPPGIRNVAPPPQPTRAAPPDLESEPVVLTATTTVAPNSTSGFNSIALQNPLKLPMEVLEIRVQLACATPITGAAVGMKLTLGSFDITKDYVPVHCFDAARNEYGELYGSANSTYYASFSWRLAHPIFVPSGALINPDVQHRGFTSSPITVTVSYLGRSLPAGTRAPTSTKVPYVASYSSKTFDTFSVSADTDQSTETDLVNHTNAVLHLERIVGRVSSNYFDSNQALNVDLSADAALRLLSIRMSDSQGNGIVPRVTQFGQVFPFATHAWRVDATIPVGGYYVAYLSKIAAGPSVTGYGLTTFGVNQYQSQATIAIVGWREVR